MGLPIYTSLLTSAILLFSQCSANVAKWAAMGDSYASGIGAGDRGQLSGDQSCSRYTEAYPRVMNVILDGTGPATRQFQNNACSGAVTTDVRDKQANAFDADIDIATISVGGNDIGFANIINNCIYQFYITASCADQIATSSALINGQAFALNMEDLGLEILEQATSPHFHLYWLGYAAFWNTDTTQCNNVTWSYWNRKNPPYLTQELRIQLNGLLEQLNSVISANVDKLNTGDPRKPVTFVNFDGNFDTHRFCEAGVNEPDGTREDTWFFEWDTVEKNSITTSAQDEDYPPGSDDAQIQAWIKQQAAEDPSLVTATGSATPHWPFDSVAKIFHPTIDGHNEIMNVVLASYAANPPKSPWQGNYVPGWCGMHIVQYQKNENSGPNKGGHDYLLDVNIYDAKQNLINSDPPGSDSGVSFVALNGIPQTVISELPHGLKVTVGAVDSDTINFEYDGQLWGTDDQQHHSNCGAYDSGKRQCDTGFSC